MTTQFDIIVLGVGAMGSSACWHLARRGVRVLGIEQYDIAHAQGSSGGDTRLVRQAYYEHTDYVPLLQRAYEHWDTIGDEIGTPLLRRTGGLYLGRPDRPFIAGSRKAADEHELAYDTLDRAAVAERFPRFDMPEHFAAMYEHDAGFVYSERAIAAFTQQATAHGATIRANERVTRWSADAHGVTVDTNRGQYTADRLVIAAGPWAATVASAFAPLLTVTRQVLGWVAPLNPSDYTMERFPCWAIEDDTPNFDGVYYGFPMIDPEDGLKLAHHAADTAIAHPDDLDRTPHDTDEADFRPVLDRYLPGAAGPTRRMHVCMYTCSPDHHFIVDRHPNERRVTIATGFSGHGFKFASVVGEALADLSMHGRSDLPIGFLGFDRFNRQATPPHASDHGHDASPD